MFGVHFSPGKYFSKIPRGKGFIAPKLRWAKLEGSKIQRYSRQGDTKVVLQQPHY